MKVEQVKEILKRCGDYYYHNRNASLNSDNKEAMRLNVIFEVFRKMGADGDYAEMIVLRMRYFDKTAIDTIAFSLGKSRRYVYYKIQSGLKEVGKQLNKMIGRDS